MIMAGGADQILAKFLKEAVNLLAYPLYRIINLSIKTIHISRVM